MLSIYIPKEAKNIYFKGSRRYTLKVLYNLSRKLFKSTCTRLLIELVNIFFLRATRPSRGVVALEVNYTQT